MGELNSSLIALPLLQTNLHCVYDSKQDRLIALMHINGITRTIHERPTNALILSKVLLP
jgi:hypothetical protein